MDHFKMVYSLFWLVLAYLDSFGSLFDQFESICINLDQSFGLLWTNKVSGWYLRSQLC